MEDDENQPKTTCQCCNDFLTCLGRSRELLYIKFLYNVMYNLGIYPEELVTENFYFKWSARTKYRYNGR